MQQKTIPCESERAQQVMTARGSEGSLVCGSSCGVLCHVEKPVGDGMGQNNIQASSCSCEPKVRQ